MAWTTDMLVAAVKRKAQAPTVGWQLTDTDVLTIAFEETTKRFIPAIRAVRQDFYTTFATIPLVANTASYRLPLRASSTTIKQVLLVQTSTGWAVPVPRLPASQGWSGLGRQSNTPYAYVIEGAQLRLLATPQNVSQYQLRVYYQRRPSNYVPVSSCSVVASTTATTIVLTAPPAWWSTGELVDVMSPEPESDLVMQDVGVTLGGSTFTITSGASTAQVVAGNYVAERDTTCVILLPDAFIHALIDATTAECLRSTGDYDAASSLEANMESTLPGVLASIAERVEAQPQPIRNNNAGLLQSGRLRGGWGWGQ